MLPPGLLGLTAVQYSLAYTQGALPIIPRLSLTRNPFGKAPLTRLKPTQQRCGVNAVSDNSLEGRHPANPHIALVLCLLVPIEVRIPYPQMCALAMSPCLLYCLDGCIALTAVLP
jgi:hypothetical protein